MGCFQRCIIRPVRSRSGQAVPAIEAMEPRALFSGDVSVQSTPPVWVTGLYVSGTAWSRAFKQHLQDTNQGIAAAGYAIVDRPVPWINVDQVSIRFDAPVTAGPEDLLLRGVAGDYPAVGYKFDPATKVATWTLARPLGSDHLFVRLNVDGPGGVADLTTGLLIDGDRIGGPGGDFTARFDALPGAVRRFWQVSITDSERVRQRLLSATTDASGRPYLSSYDAFSDLDADGRVGVSDLAHVRRRLFTRLPDEFPPESAPAAPAGTLAPARTRPPTRDLFGALPIL